MQRIPDHMNPEYGIKVIRPIFNWIKCDICKNEYRREPIWRILITSYPLSYLNKYHYVCSNCIKNLDEAIEYREDIRKPPPPPKIIQEVPSDIKEAIRILKNTANLLRPELHFNLIVRDMENSINSIERYILKMNKL